MNSKGVTGPSLSIFLLQDGNACEYELLKSEHMQSLYLPPSLLHLLSSRLHQSLSAEVVQEADVSRGPEEGEFILFYILFSLYEV